MKISLAVVILILALAAAPLSAQDRNIHITIFASQVQLEGDNAFDEGFDLEVADGNALGAAVNMFVTPRFSVEAAVFGVRTDAELMLEGAPLFDLGEFSLTPFTLGAQFHVLGGSRFDPYIGGGAAYVIGDDFFTPETELAGIGRVELENEVTWYINAGVGFQVTPGFGIVLDARQIQYEPSSRSTVTGTEQDLELSPRILSAGLRLRF